MTAQSASQVSTTRALTASQRLTLAQIVNAFVPLQSASNDTPLAPSGSEPLEHLVRRIETMRDQSSQTKLLGLLDKLERPWFCGFAFGIWKGFHHQSPNQQVELIRRWRDHRLASLRSTYHGLKRIIHFAAYGMPTNENIQGVWQEIGYRLPQKPDSPETISSPILTAANRAPTQDKWSSDVVVIGSGAGGSVAANRLAAAGLQVTILEKGSLPLRSEMGQSEWWGNRHLLEKHGSLSTPDLSLVLLAGSTVGGGTVANWMTSLEPPQEVLDEWAKDYGLTAAADGRLLAACQAVAKRLGVRTAPEAINPQNEVLRQGCQKLGWRFRDIPRNAPGCGNCDFCGYGCNSGNKQDMRRSFLADAVNAGAALVANTQVERIERPSPHDLRIHVITKDADGQRRSRQVACRAVVVAAGSINTPAILARSGFSHQQIGRNLHVHPTTAIASYFEHSIRPWAGAPQSIVCDEHDSLDSQGYGFRLETAPCHPGFGALAFAWDSPSQHGELVRQLDHLANLIILVRDRGAGSVRALPNGSVQVDYRITPQDMAHLKEGVIRAMQVHGAAGAKWLLGPFAKPMVLSNRPDLDHETITRQLNRGSFRPNDLPLYSAHQMSTCRISGNRQLGPVSPEGCLWEADNVWVADTSLFPTASGVNPMLTCMGLADVVAQQAARRLQTTG